MAAPDQGNWIGRRDHALLEVAAQTGLRVSELTGLRNCDIELGTGAHVRCRGKGRKDRCTPLSRQTVTVLRAWPQEPGGDPADPLFPSRRGTALSRGAVTTLVARHTATASQHCPSLRSRHPTPHILWHSYLICTAFSAPGTARSRVHRTVPQHNPVLGEARATRPVPGSFSLRCCF